VPKKRLDPDDLPIWNRHPDYEAPRKASETPKVLPRPTAALGHEGGYTGDQWHVIEALLKHDGSKFKVKLKCHGTINSSATSLGDPCPHYIETVVWKALYDPFVKYLCPECINERGFMWGTQLEQDEMRATSTVYVGYQLVRNYAEEDPTDKQMVYESLWRRLDTSENHKEEIHKPLAIHDELKRKPQ